MRDRKARHSVITLKVNGESHTVAVKQGETLLDVLRNKLGMTGTKKGCDQGVCGACTVLIDGRAKNSCLLLAVACDNAEVTTIEGVSRDGKLHPLQRSFISHGAIQSG